jgi:hypothetical protein
LASLALVASVALLAWPWRVEGTLQASSKAAISLAAGVEVASLSVTAAGILGGPGVLAVHLRGRELSRRGTTELTLEALLDWLERPRPPGSKPSRLVARVKEALLARTDAAELPGLGLAVLGGLRDVSVNGRVHCGFADPGLTGKAAAWIYPVAAVLAPFGTLEVAFDWTGNTVLEAGVEGSFRVVPARVAFAVLRFARRHVHLRRTSRAVSSTLAATSTT